MIGDYAAGTPDKEQGGFALLDPNETDPHKWFDKYMNPSGGGDWPEAYKTALNFMLRHPPGILFLFLDAPPHDGFLDKEGIKEYNFLIENNMITGWEKLAQALKQQGHRIVTFITGRHQEELKRDFYDILGDVVMIPENVSDVITSTMMDTLEWSFEPKKSRLCSATILQTQLAKINAICRSSVCHYDF